MEQITVCAHVLGHAVCMTALPAGEDWNITVLGGCAPHVGSVSLAEYENGTVKLRTLLREAHKDQVVGDHVAQRLAEQEKCTVCVSCGIHYEGLSREEITQVVDCANGLLEQLCRKIHAAQSHK